MLEGCVEVSLRRQLLDEPANSAEVTLFDFRVCVRRAAPGYVLSLVDEREDATTSSGLLEDEADACRTAARVFTAAIEGRD